MSEKDELAGIIADELNKQFKHQQVAYFLDEGSTEETTTTTTTTQKPSPTQTEKKTENVEDAFDQLFNS